MPGVVHLHAISVLNEVSVERNNFGIAEEKTARPNYSWCDIKQTQALISGLNSYTISEPGVRLG